MLADSDANLAPTGYWRWTQSLANSSPPANSPFVGIYREFDESGAVIDELDAQICALHCNSSSRVPQARNREIFVKNREALSR